MANRRFGGGSVSKAGFSQQGYQGNKVSPWQGGNAPGNAGLLSSMAAPQAQLALALSSLLQPQSNPPSLLSLNTSGSSYNNQDNYGSGRFDRGRDFRRLEPYKNNQGRFGGGSGSWRDNSTRPLGGPPNRSGGNRPIGARNGRFNRDKPAGKPKGKFDSKKEKKQDESDSQNESRDEGNTKRDWKREKKDDETAESVDLTAEEEDAKDGDEKKVRDKSGRYKGVPASLLHCFVCSKSMWDGESFQNHLKGKAHKQMMDSLGQSFQVTVNILRENMRLMEEKKVIELDRMSRSSRYRGRPMNDRSHCNMCDLEFLGKIVSHRKTEGHQRLKRFLHPNCNHCEQEFPARMEWLDHRLTPEHLRKVAEVLDKKEGGEDGAPIQEEVLEMNNDPILEETIQTEDEDPVLELKDDLKDLHNRIPAYKPNRAVGKDNVKFLNGFYCDICIRFLSTDELAQAHLKSEKHYKSFVEAIKLKYQQMNEAKERAAKRRQAEEAADAETKKIKLGETTEDGGDKYDPEEACDEDSALDNTTLDEEMNEVETLIKSEDDLNQSAAANGTEDKNDSKQAAENTRTRRAATAASPVTSTPAPVKNGAAAPKGKVTRRGGK